MQPDFQASIRINSSASSSFSLASEAILRYDDM